MVQLYFALSILIGLALIVDGITLRAAQGKCNATPLLILTTSLEAVWVLVSIFALTRYTFESWFLLIPTVYITHNLLGWAYGIWRTFKMRAPSAKTPIITVPPWYVTFCISFGVLFTSINTIAVLLNE